MREISRIACRRLRLAYEDGPAATQVADDGRVAGSEASLVDGRSVLGRQPRHFDDVLHADRDTRQRSASEGCLWGGTQAWTLASTLRIRSRSAGNAASRLAGDASFHCRNVLKRCAL